MFLTDGSEAWCRGAGQVQLQNYGASKHNRDLKKALWFSFFFFFFDHKLVNYLENIGNQAIWEQTSSVGWIFVK